VVFTSLGLIITRVPRWRLVGHRMAKAWARSCVWAAGCSLRVDGLDGIDPDERFVLMVNHQSALDIPSLMAVLPAEWRTVFWAKKSLFRIPFLGWAMRMLGHMPVDRVQRRKAVAMFSESVRSVGERKSLLVFPEETYSPDGELLPLKRGGFLFALKTGLPVLPVGVWGTRRALPPRHRLLSPTALHIRFGSPIRTVELAVSELDGLMEQTRDEIEALKADPSRRD
jgi:1-acyl-sn-glycerol-3-phosphate acyltransferase